ncbi:RHS repeat domain-containing protein [Pseudomonas syringae]|uniref:Putative insecticidal toxin complex protein C2 n=1 Tax=Pseudomonas syringae pv. solidagae TaxID=264458 RepID=A0A3M5LGE5_PSESX|nr:RHS repeat-associated core domain-containing protein [Pseudomonas syringae]RMT46825.1 putative insecticidal toxin complex protein C2 [Pseudomonas syringae pv. solidagae]
MVSSAVHAHTPELLVCEGRGLVVRQVLLHRTEATEAAAMRVTRQRFDPAGRMIAATDPRLASANRSTVYSLGGNALATESVDAGWQRVLFGEAGQVLRDWDGRGTEKQLEYDLHLRPTRIIEQNRCAERFTYGQAGAAAHNQCNQLVRHDDTAGSRLLADYGLLGVALCEERQFLKTPESPDWPLAEAERDALLEPVVLQTCWRFNALGDALAQTDAMGNTQASGMTVAGQLKAAGLTLAGASQPQTLVNEIHYNAFNQVEQETAGNGVVSRYVYDLQDGRLIELSALSADGSVLQKLNYSYDPAGNVLLINDASQPDRYCGNQRIEPINRYCYDTLYQLIEATGREVRNGASHGPALPGLQPLPTLDPCQVSNYRQHYSYDRAGNLLQMRHEGAHNFTRNMHVAPDSNRSLPDDDEDVDFATSFDPNGNLLQLVRGQVMGWDARNQLQHIITVQREDGSNDDERYVYDGQGQRSRKISTAQASGRTLSNEVRYLPGLEIRTTADGEILHVITAQAGRNSVRVLHWEAGKPDGIANDQVRYSLGDHLGSSTLELDQQGGLISQESYYPFGGTAWWAARNAVDARYKTVRYSGKERDASGLYYYGFRYYAPWLQRWINPDPAGAVDGLNLYTMVGNSPLRNKDIAGLQHRPYQGFQDAYEQQASSSGLTLIARGRENIKLLKKPPTDKLGHALEVVEVAYKESQRVFNSGDLTETQKVVVWNVMGYTSLAQMPEMASQYASLNDVVQDYTAGHGFNQFAVFGRQPGTQGLTFSNDPHKRIFLGREVLDFHVLGTALVMGHEISHTTQRRSKDYIYMNANVNRDEGVEQLTPGDVDEHLQSMLESASHVTAGQHDHVIFSNIDSMIREGKLTADDVTSLFATRSLQDIHVNRLTYPGVRDRILRNNADNIAFLGLFLGREQVVSKMKARGYVK